MRCWKQMATMIGLCILPFAGLGIASAMAQEAASAADAPSTEINITILNSATQKTEREFPCFVSSRGAGLALFDAPATLRINRRLDDLSILCIKEGFEPVRMTMGGEQLPAVIAPRVMASVKSAPRVMASAE